MKKILKTLYLVLVLILFVLGGFFSASVFTKDMHFDKKYIGYSESYILKEFGKPDLVRSFTLNSCDKDLFHFYEDFINDCNKDALIKHYHYDKLIRDIDFWILEKTKNETIVILVL